MKKKPTKQQLEASKAKAQSMVANIAADKTDPVDPCVRLRQLKEAIEQTLVDLNCDPAK